MMIKSKETLISWGDKMKSMEWAYLLDLLVDIVQNSAIYNKDIVLKLQKLINYVGKMDNWEKVK